jgi:hypothetical protein
MCGMYIEDVVDEKTILFCIIFENLSKTDTEVTDSKVRKSRMDHDSQ